MAKPLRVSCGCGSTAGCERCMPEAYNTPAPPDSPMRAAFVRQYGEIGRHYDEDTWLARYGVWVSAWTEAMKYKLAGAERGKA